MKSIFICLFALLFLAGNAQQVHILPLSEVQKIHKPYSGGYQLGLGSYYLVDRPKTLDKSRARITYELTMQTDTISGNVSKDRITLLLGDLYYKTYSQTLWQLSLNHTNPRNGLDYRWMKNYSILLPSTTYRNHRTHRIQNRVLFPYMEKKVYQYDESEPGFQWDLQADTLAIGGYVCRKATTHYAGRDWSVWYTTDIPVDGGLWKFRGLPGLILDAADSKMQFHFRMTAIEQREEMLVQYVMPTKKLTRELFRQSERKAYQHPLDGFYAITGQNYLVVIRIDNKQTEVITEDDCPPIFYNPLELK